MFPLSDAIILAPLIAGFALEQVVMDTLINEFKETILKTPENEIVNKLTGILKGRKQTIISARSTRAYTEPSEAKDIVNI